MNEAYERMIRNLRRKCSECLEAFSELEDEGMSGRVTFRDADPVDLRVLADQMLDITLEIRRIQRALKEPAQ